MDLLSFFIAACGIPFLLTNLFGFRFIGLTGGISTGKSTVSKILREWGVPVIDFDVISRDVVKPGSSTLKTLEKEFGKEVINADGSLNRTALGNIIFNDPSKRRKLNAIMQRPIFLEFIRRALVLFFMGTAHKVKNIVSGDDTLCPGLLHNLGGSKVIILDVPLLFEAGFDKICSETVFVDATAETQLQRLMARDGITEKEATAKINAQMKVEVKRKLATHTIDNNSGFSELRAATRAWLCGVLVRSGVWDAAKVAAGEAAAQKGEEALTAKSQGNVTHRSQRLSLAGVKASSGEDKAGVAVEHAAFAQYVPSMWWYLNPAHWLLRPTLPALIVAVMAAVPGYFLINFLERFAK